MAITIELRKKGPPPGVDLGSGWMKVVVLGLRRKKPYLRLMGRSALALADMDNGKKTGARLAELWKQLDIRDTSVVSAMTGHAVIVKKVSIANDALKDMDQFLAKDAKQYIPFDLHDVYLDHQLLGPGDKENTHEVLLVASKKREVEERLHILTLAGLGVQVMDVDAFAVSNCFEFNYPEYADKPQYILDIGGNLSVFCVVWQNQLVFHRELSMGGHHLTERLAKALEKPHAFCEKLKINGPENNTDVDLAVAQETVESALSAWSAEIRRLMGFYLGSVPNAKPASNLFLSGGGSLLAGLPQKMARELELDVQRMDPWRKLAPDPARFAPEYLQSVAPQFVVATGLALREATR